MIVAPVLRGTSPKNMPPAYGSAPVRLVPSTSAYANPRTRHATTFSVHPAWNSTRRTCSASTTGGIASRGSTTSRVCISRTSIQAFRRPCSEAVGRIAASYQYLVK
eukprot:3531429-Rhodomonas_salina.1